jgi:hypothetical protein
MARGDKYVPSMGVITERFHWEFDDFAARMAHELRHEMVYRFDGGMIARGLLKFVFR